MTPHELLNAGQLTAALDAATVAVKQHPRDTAQRTFLAELLCFQNEWERADKQCESIAQVAPESIVGVSFFRQLIRAEIARKQFFEEGRMPEFLHEPTPVMWLHLRASIALRDNRPAEAATLLAQADELRVRPQGSCDDQPFQDLRDLDDLTAPVCEVLTSTGKYYWIGWEQIRQIELESIERTRDLRWRRARMVFAGDSDGEVYLPTLYPLTRTVSDDALRLGRATDWRASPGEPVLGLGQRTLLVGQQALPILQIKELKFHPI